MNTKIKIQTSKGELIAIVELISIYYGQKLKFEQEDKTWIMISFLIAGIFKRIISRLYKVDEYMDAHEMKFSLQRGEGVALLYLLRAIDEMQLPFSAYLTNVMVTYILKLDQALA